MEGSEIAIKAVFAVIGLFFTFAMAALGYFMTRLRSDSNDIKTSIKSVGSETRENRAEIHRLEVKMSQEFAPKSELHDLRTEMRQGFAETQKMIMELFRDRPGD